MAVAVDATGTAGTASLAANNTGFTEGASTITIGAGANRVLVLFVQFSAATIPTNTTVSWDSAGSGQPMTLIGQKAESDNLACTAIYGRLGPTSGSGRLLKMQWDPHVAMSYTYCMMSFTGADQGSVATTFKNFLSGNPAATAASGGAAYPPTTGVNVNSPVGDFCVLCGASNNMSINLAGSLSGQVGTQLYGLNTNVSGGAVYTTGAGASTNLALAMSNASSNPACYAAFDIAAVGTVGGLPAGLNPIFSEQTPPLARTTDFTYTPQLVNWLTRIYAIKPPAPNQQRSDLFDAPPPPRPGTPERWRPFFDLAYIYAQQPVGAISVEVHRPAPMGNPEPWKSFFDLAYLYAQKPVGVTLAEVHPPALKGNPEYWKSFFDLSGIYAQVPVGATSVEVHPLAPKGNPEFWEGILDNLLPQIYTQKPIGAISVEVHPLALMGNPERWRSFYDLAYLYAQSPVGVASVEVHPLAPKGNPENWKSFFDLSSVYSQQPVGARQDADAPPIYVKGPELLPPDLLTTTLGVTVTVTLPFVYYDFSAHPSPVPPSQFVPNPNALPQIYSQAPVGQRWKDDAHPLPIPPISDVYQNILLNLPVTVILPFVYYDFSAHPPQIPPAQYVPNINTLPQVYSQSPVGTRQLSFDTPPTIRGNPEAWMAMLNNQLPVIYAFKPIASWFDFGIHPAYAPPAENILFPNLVLPFLPAVVQRWLSYISSSYIMGSGGGGGGGPVTPANALVAEDGTTFLVAEDGTTFLVQEV
jgi:hypothetical protein